MPNPTAGGAAGHEAIAFTTMLLAGFFLVLLFRADRLRNWQEPASQGTMVNLVRSRYQPRVSQRSNLRVEGQAACR